MSALCGPGCGYCGRCSAEWEREDEDDDNPHCADCGCDLFTEEHDWDCAFYGEDDEDEEAAAW